MRIRLVLEQYRRRSQAVRVQQAQLLAQLSVEVVCVVAAVEPPRRDGRLLRRRLAATRCLARLAARRTLDRARVSPLNALGLQNLLAMAGIILMVRPNI